jgi:alpha-1,6-mannosyltransferase
MRIVQVANFYGPRSGGIRTTMHQLASGYQHHGHESVLVVPGERDSDVVEPYGRVITLAAREVPRSGGYRVITDVDRVCTVLDGVRPDRLEVSDRLSLRSLGWWARASDVPAVMWAHERVDGVLRSFLPALVPSRTVANAWNRSTARRFDRIVCSTQFAQQEFDRIGWDRVAHVPLGVDLATFHPSRYDAGARAGLLGPGHDVLLVLCSRLSPEKRPDVAFDTLVELRRRGVHARLVVMGSGPMQDSLARRARRLPVTMLGHVPDRARVAEVLACADVVLAPGPIETFGLAALEALASGTPVVASESSAVGEIVLGGASFAVPTNADAFADAVLACVATPEASRRGAARARAELFPWSSTIDAMLEVHGLGVQSGSAPDALSTAV